MKSILFRLSGSRALLLEADSAPTDRANVYIEGGIEGKLLLGEKQITIRKDGTAFCADHFPCGIYTPAVFANGKRYEAPPLSIGGGYFSFLPPTHAQINRLEQRLQALETSCAELTKRICLIEGRMQDTNIF